MMTVVICLDDLVIAITCLLVGAAITAIVDAIRFSNHGGVK